VVKAIYDGSQFVDSVSEGEEVGIVLESTSFYAEQGGQIHDTGSCEGPSGTFDVRNVQIYGGYVLHMGSLVGETGSISVGDEVICKVDYVRRTFYRSKPYLHSHAKLCTEGCPRRSRRSKRILGGSRQIALRFFPW